MGIGSILFGFSPSPSGERQRDLRTCSLVAAGWEASALRFVAGPHRRRVDQPPADPGRAGGTTDPTPPSPEGEGL